MIVYKSTRGEERSYTFTEAIVKGIANDGGLLVPTSIPAFSIKRLQQLKNVSYQEIAQFILDLFQTDIPSDKLRGFINAAYGKNFDSSKITPISHIQQQQYFLELWHGPTAAFKDMALQLMPFLFSYAAQKHNPNLHNLILVATSGDTGKAALEGYKDKQDISLMVFYPHKRVSKLQQLQMQTQKGTNLSVFAMRGDFDDCQKSVKSVFGDQLFRRELLEKYKIVLSSANSINWGRLLPQIIYYISGYLQLVKEHKLQIGDKIDVVVPTGNFGNLLAGLYVKKMGLPINKLICASNENNVLTEFLQTGGYSLKKRTLVKTPSPSMDILLASNIERLLFLITTDAKKVSFWMRQLQEKQQFKVDKATKVILQELFAADWVNNKDCLDNIKNIFEKTGYIMDPHTSVAQKVATQYTEKTSSQMPVLILSTAHFSKFAKDVFQALYGRKEKKDEFIMLSAIQKRVSNIAIPASILNLQNKKVRHDTICEKGKIALEQKIIYMARGIGGPPRV